MYKCAMCQLVYKVKQVKIDHIEPVVDPVKGFTGWEDYINRMYPENANAFQILCEQCHTSKTAVERELRKKYKKPVSKVLTKKKK